jgi:hypothetical protein
MARKHEGESIAETTATPARWDDDADDVSERPNGETVADMSEFAAEDTTETRDSSEDFSLEDVALAQDFNPNEVEEEPPVACKRPPRDDYFRVHQDPKMTVTVGIYEPVRRDVSLGR